MSKKLFTNIKGIVQYQDTNSPVFKRGAAMDDLNILENAWMLVDQTIEKIGVGRAPQIEPDNEIDCYGQYILPGFIDSHTHLVFANTRQKEFEMRIAGASYQEIAEAGGGILNSAEQMEDISEDELFEESVFRLEEIIAKGTLAVEIKSGYGLTADSELKMLRVIKRLKQVSPVNIKATFLGAHTFPSQYKNDHKAYLKIIEEEMLPEIQLHKLADYMDVFCETGYYSLAETQWLINLANKYNIPIRLHANQLANSGGVQLGVKNNVVSVDHLEEIAEAEILALLNSNVIPTLLPSAAFFLGSKYAPARAMIDAGLGVVLATDFNPGSSPGSSMSFVASLACLSMKMTVNEAINAMTINAAFALGLQQSHGLITTGRDASFIITEPIDDIACIPYYFSRDCISEVYIKGRSFNGINI